MVTLITAGVSLLTTWVKGKQEVAEKKTELKKATQQALHTHQMKLLEGEQSESLIRIKAMNNSWKDEWWLVIFSIPLVNMFISPFLDLYYLGEYQEGMLALAASEALQNLDKAPLWYITTILMMVFLSWGYKRGFDNVLGLLNKRK